MGAKNSKPKKEKKDAYSALRGEGDDTGPLWVYPREYYPPRNVRGGNPEKSPNVIPVVSRGFDTMAALLLLNPVHSAIDRSRSPNSYVQGSSSDRQDVAFCVFLFKALASASQYDEGKRPTVIERLQESYYLDGALVVDLCRRQVVLSALNPSSPVGRYCNDVARLLRKVLDQNSPPDRNSIDKRGDKEEEEGQEGGGATFQLAPFDELVYTEQLVEGSLVLQARHAPFSGSSSSTSSCRYVSVFFMSGSYFVDYTTAVVPKPEGQYQKVLLSDASSRMSRTGSREERDSRNQQAPATSSQCPSASHYYTTDKFHLPLTIRATSEDENLGEKKKKHKAGVDGKALVLPLVVLVYSPPVYINFKVNEKRHQLVVRCPSKYTDDVRDICQRLEAEGEEAKAIGGAEEGEGRQQLGPQRRFQKLVWRERSSFESSEEKFAATMALLADVEKSVLEASKSF